MCPVFRSAYTCCVCACEHGRACEKYHNFKIWSNKFKAFISLGQTKHLLQAGFRPWPSCQQPLASVTLDPQVHPWARLFVRGTGERTGGLCSGQIPPPWLWGRNSTFQSTAVPLQLFRSQQGEQLPGTVRTAEHPQPELGEYGFELGQWLFFLPLLLIRLGWAAGFVHKQETRELGGGTAG